MRFQSRAITLWIWVCFPALRNGMLSGIKKRVERDAGIEKDTY